MQRNGAGEWQLWPVRRQRSPPVMPVRPAAAIYLLHLTLAPER